MNDRLAYVKKEMAAFHRETPSSPFHNIKSPFPMQQPTYYYYPGLDSRPFHDRKNFSWVERLEAAVPDMCRELDEILATKSGFQKAFDMLAETGEWGAFYVSMWGEKEKLKANRALCPKTVEVIESIPYNCGFNMFSAMAPKTHILPHCGPANTRIRCHLPLRIPKGCKIRVGTEVVPWVEGRVLFLDDSWEHEVWNPTDQPRFLFLFDVLHPNFDEDERQFIMDLEEKAARDIYVKRCFEDAPPAGDWVYKKL